jgi:hypothetical protein
MGYSIAATMEAGVMKKAYEMALKQTKIIVTEH